MVASAAIGGLISIGGTLAGMNANSKAAKAEQKALEARATAKREQADEIIKRNEFNIKELRTDAHTFMQSQTSEFAASGIAIGTGITLGALEDTQNRMFKQMEIETREAEFTADQLRRGADVDVIQGANAARAAKSQNTARFLQGVGGAATSFIKGS